MALLALAGAAAATTDAQTTTTCAPPATTTPAGDCATPPPVTTTGPEPAPTTPPPPPKPKPPVATTPAPPAATAPAKQPAESCADPADRRCSCPERWLALREHGATLEVRRKLRRDCPPAKRRHKAKRKHTAKRHARTPAARRRAAARRRRRQAAAPKLKRDSFDAKHRFVPITQLQGKPLPDPLPRAKRLDHRFATMVEQVSRTNGASWALVLATLRQRGADGPKPADEATVTRLAAKLAGAKHPAERTGALADYNRAVGAAGLVHGLDAEKKALGKRVLANKRIDLYWGGRGDIEAGRIDVRVLVTLLYLARREHTVGVSCLIAGHSLFTKSGNISLHSFGRAVDISTLGGTAVLGHQQPGGITEHALRSVLLLPKELQPSELISLFSLGGPSFALPDHANHVHVGF